MTRHRKSGSHWYLGMSDLESLNLGVTTYNPGLSPQQYHCKYDDMQKQVPKCLHKDIGILFPCKANNQVDVGTTQSTYQFIAIASNHTAKEVYGEI